MPETIVVCVDNSDWSRNCDYSGSRLDAQQDTINVICNVKSNANIENSIGVLTMAGERVRVRVTPTSDVKEVQCSMHGLEMRGHADLVRGIQVAQLALKHRTHKTQKQRILCFVGSPVDAPLKQLETLGKQLKKNNVALDLVSFGNVTENQEKLTRLHAAVDNNQTSHYLECPPCSSQLLSDMVVNSALVRGENVTPVEVGGDPVQPMNEFGVDPNLDPDLYMALRISMEEEQARTRRETDAPAANPPQALPIVTPEDIDDTEADEELRQALLLSMQDYAGETPAPPAPAEPAAQSEPTVSNVDQEFLACIPGVDLTDERLQAALRAATQPDGDTKKEPEPKDESG